MADNDIRERIQLCIPTEFQYYVKDTKTIQADLGYWNYIKIAIEVDVFLLLFFSSNTCLSFAMSETYSTTLVNVLDPVRPAINSPTTSHSNVFVLKTIIQKIMVGIVSKNSVRLLPIRDVM